MKMQQSCTIRKHRIDIDVLYVRQMRHRILWQVQIAKVLYHAVVVVYLVHLLVNLVEEVAGLPLVLTDNAQQAVEPAGDDDRRHRLENRSHLYEVRTFFLSFLIEPIWVIIYNITAEGNFSNILMYAMHSSSSIPSFTFSVFLGYSYFV